jgi:pimeloyl-ACP methyl ester carboxylesterase
MAADVHGLLHDHVSAGAYLPDAITAADHPDIAEDVTAALISDCGHWIPEERPHQLADELIAFDRAARAPTTQPLPTPEEQP